MKVRALVRPDSEASHLSLLGIEKATGDLRDPDSIESACKDVTFVMATANSVSPRKPGDRLGAVDGQGYRDLIDAAVRCGVRQFVYTSVISLPGDNKVPLLRVKRATERYLVASGISYTVIRAATFMDIAFAMMGSDLPIRGAVAPTVERPFWFTQSFFKKVRSSVTRGKVTVAGTGKTRHSYIAIDDVAEYMVRSLDSPGARNRILQVGGPEPLSLLDVAGILERLLGKKMRISATPSAIFAIMGALLRPVSPAAANIMTLNYWSATQDGVVPNACETAAEFGIPLTTAEQFLRQRLQFQETEEP
jgi:uncharacterized protein YbjT (DUF2867 family)